jgi:hypothetical protein
MAGRKRKEEAGKNRNLDKFLKTLEIAEEKRGKIVSFVEDLTFKQLKGLVVPKEEEKKPKLRLNKPWEKK